MSLERVQAMGILVRPEAAALIEQGGEAASQRLIEKLASMPGKPLVLDTELTRRLMLPDARLLKRIISPPGNNTGPNQNSPSDPGAGPNQESGGPQSVGDLAAAWGDRFSVLQRVLMKRPEMANATSLGGAVGQCAVIGQVRARGTKLELEDPTGAVELILPPSVQAVLGDDIIGAVGRIEGGVLRADSVVWPDVPLHQAAATQGKVMVGGTNSPSGSLAGQIPEADWNIKPAGTEWWEIGGVKLLVHRADWAQLGGQLKIKEQDVPAEMLKRRHLFRPPGDAMEPVPDVFVAVGLDVQGAYRGTLIAGSKEGTLIDLGSAQ